MHFALLSHSLPQQSTCGGPMTCWAIVEQMLSEGHQVTVVCLQYPQSPFAEEKRQQVLAALGVQLIVVNVAPQQRLGEDGPASWFPTGYLRAQMARVLRSLAPDAMFIYHWDTLAAIYGLRIAPRLAGMGDPWHLPNLRRWQSTRPTPTLRYLKRSLAVLRDRQVYPRAMVQLLNDCEASRCFQHQAADWLRQQGAPQCLYAPTPIIDACGPAWRARRDAAAATTKPTILLGPSRLTSTSTSAGLRLFATEILPRLEQVLGPEGFEVRIVGGGDPPAELAQLLPRPSITLVGRVEPADGEFLAADVQLVPTPFVLGIRVRIVAGLSFGCCVVAHRNDAANIPELVHGENALLASTGQGLAEAVITALRDKQLRDRLGANARHTYETAFHPRVAAQQIVRDLEHLVAQRLGPLVPVEATP